MGGIGGTKGGADRIKRLCTNFCFVTVVDVVDDVKEKDVPPQGTVGHGVIGTVQNQNRSKLLQVDDGGYWWDKMGSRQKIFRFSTLR